MEIVFDTYAWIEYFEGSSKGKKVDEILSDKSMEIITPIIVLLELSYKSKKERWNFERYLKFIKSKSKIAGINDNFILKFGEIYNEQKRKNKEFGLADAIVLTTAIICSGKVLTGDEHFSHLKEAIML